MTKFDLAALNAADACAKPIDLELKHWATKEPLGMFITHKGSLDRGVKNAVNRQANQMLAKNFEAQRKGTAGEAPTVEDSQRRSAAVLVEATVEWFTADRDKKGNLTNKVPGWPMKADSDERMLFSQDNALQIYEDPGYEWIKLQLDASINDLENFT
jgi:hypothetical protein